MNAMTSAMHNGRAALVAISVLTTMATASAQPVFSFGFEGTSLLDNCALSFECFPGFPPDTMGAVGTTQFLEATNGSVTVYDKLTGTVLQRTSMQIFWTNAGQPGTVNGYQRVLFDHYTNRWIMSGLGSATNLINIAVSDTADATGIWKSVQITSLQSGGIADVPTLSIDDKGVYIGSNNFTSTGSFTGTNLHVIPKASLFPAVGAPSLAGITTFNTPPAGPDNGFQIQPALNWQGNLTNTVSVIADSRGVSDQVFYKVSGVTAAGATQTASIHIAGSGYTVSGAGRQPDGTRTVPTLSGLITANAGQYNGRIYSTIAARADAAIGDFSAVRWTVVDAASGLQLSSGKIQQANYDFYQGAIAINEFGEAVIAYNRSGFATTDANGDLLPDGNISFLARAYNVDVFGALVQDGAEMLLKVSPINNYHCAPSPSCLERWGDYAAVTLDPTNHHIFYAIGEYALSNEIIPGVTTTPRSIYSTYVASITSATGCSNANGSVTNGNDSGTGSLRDVLANVCAGSTVTFSPNVTAVTLTSRELVLNKSLTINGPGPTLLSIQRSTAPDTANFRIFNIPFASVQAVISGLTIEHGDAGVGDGGGINNLGGGVTLTGVTISGNGAVFGAGINNLGGSLMLTSGAITGNSAFLGSGGINNQGGPFVINNATISGNSSLVGSGGIFNDGLTTITNGTISGNMASGGNGGGVYNAGSLNITNSTIVRNSATGNGGGINASVSGTVTARNSIIALNTSPSGPNVKGTLNSGGFNLIGSVSGVFVTPPQASDQLGVTSPQLNLDALHANGGPTPTHALLTGSVAIDKGNSSGSATDQRGVPRPIDLVSVTNVTGGDGGDIGAFEFGAPDTDGDGVPDSIDNCSLVANTSQLDADSDGYGNICDADLNNSGLVTTADFGILRSVLNQSAGSSATAAAADLNGSGTVTTADFAILRARLNTPPGPSGLHPSCPPMCP